MSNAQLFVEAVDTALTVYRWAVGWLIFLSTVAAILVVVVAACGAWGVKAARSRLGGRVRAEHATPVPEPHRPAKRRPVPSWAHTEPYTYDHAA